MRRVFCILSIGLCLFALAASDARVARAQAAEPRKEQTAGQEVGGLQPPAPGPELAKMQKAVGKWKAVVKMWMDPKQPPMVSEGIMEVKSSCGGLWFLTEFKTTSGMPMEGHGIDGYDPKKGKYVGTWIDSWSTFLSLYEGTFDASGKFLNCIMDSRDMQGNPVRYATRTEYRDANTEIFQTWPGPEPKGSPTMEITYTRM